MKGKISNSYVFVICFFLVFFVYSHPVSFGQEKNVVSRVVTLDAKVKTDVVEGITKLFIEKYIFLETAEKMGELLATKLKKGEYEQIDDVNEFARELSICDLLIITEIYPAREKPLAGVSSELIVNEAQKLGFDQVHYIPDKSKITEYLIDEVSPGDLVIFMGAGDIYKNAQELGQRLNNSAIKN